MNSTKMLFGVALIAFCCVKYSISQVVVPPPVPPIMCHVCNNSESCENPPLLNCSTELALVTRQYLDVFHPNTNLILASATFDCFHQNLTLDVGEFHYKGCIFNNVQGCSFPLRPFFMLSHYARFCNQCNDRDGCNPAGRANINMAMVFAAIIMALLGKFIWH